MHYQPDAFEPKEWSMLHAVVSRIQQHISETQLQSLIINMLTDLTLRRRTISVESSNVGIFKRYHDEDSIGIRGYSTKHLINTLKLLCDIGVILREQIHGYSFRFTLNVNEMLMCYIKLKALEGLDTSRYEALLRKSKMVFPNNTSMFVIRGDDVMSLKTIEEAIAVGQEKKRNRIKSSPVKKNESATELSNNLVSIVKSHGFAMPPIAGVRHFSMLKRFLKDCAARGLNVYNTIDYLCVNMGKLIDYLEPRDSSITLFRDFFDFEKIYFNRATILSWVSLTQKFGFDFDEVEDEEKVVSIKCRQRRG